MEVVLTSLSNVCGGEKGSYTRARSLAGPGGAWRDTRAHDVRVNGPPKSSSSPCGDAASFCCFCFGYLAFKSTEIWNPNRFSNFSEPITTRGRGLFYITDLSASTKTHLIELGFCLSSLLRCLRSCSIPNAGVHRRTGEQVSGTARSCDPAPGEGE